MIEWNTDEGVDGTDPADVAGETLMAAATMTHDRGDDEAQIVMLPAGGEPAAEGAIALAMVDVDRDIPEGVTHPSPTLADDEEADARSETFLQGTDGLEHVVELEERGAEGDVSGRPTVSESADKPAAAADTAPRRHRRQSRSEAVLDMDGVTQRAPWAPPEQAPVAEDHTDEPAAAAEDGTAAAREPAPGDDDPDAAWRQHWPHNELVIFGRIDPNVSLAPTVDGISRIRAMVEIIEIDPLSGESGIVAKVPVQILPIARGFDPIYNEIRRARKQHQRIEPFTIELRGASKRLQDKDKRYAHTRWSMLFGLEVSLVRRAERNVEQYGRWRGAGTVTNVQPFDIGSERYFRVTLSVGAAKRKAQLRGASSATHEVDVLVPIEHEHAQRFRHGGQRLLVEAEVFSRTSVLRETHPDLDGLDDELKERLRILRQGLLLVTMGEFPDVEAEEEFAAWVRAGSEGIPGRPGRRSQPHRRQRSAETQAQGEGTGTSRTTSQPASQSA